MREPAQPAVLQNRTSGKQAPSPIELAVSFTKLVALKRATNPTRSPKLLLEDAISEYNRVAIKKYKIDGDVKKLIVNLLKCDEEFLSVIQSHYTHFKWESSGALMRRVSTWRDDVEHSWNLHLAASAR